jgi:hypothetical protein
MRWSHFWYYVVISLEGLSKATVILRQNSGSLTDSRHTKPNVYTTVRRHLQYLYILSEKNVAPRMLHCNVSAECTRSGATVSIVASSQADGRQRFVI